MPGPNPMFFEHFLENPEGLLVLLGMCAALLPLYGLYFLGRHIFDKKIRGKQNG